MALSASNGMNNLRTTKIGLAALTIIFLLLYGYFSTLGKPLNMQTNLAGQGFAENKITLGNLGGFHLLKNINYSDEGLFHRFMVNTELNRSTASPEGITVPYLTITETEHSASLVPATDTKDKTNVIPEPASPYQIQINISDTTVADIPTNRPLAIFSDTTDNASADLVQEVRVNETMDEGALVTIFLTKKVTFRATADNSGTIVLDILK